MTTDTDIHFGDLEESSPAARLRPDRNKHFAVVGYEQPSERDLPVFIDVDVVRDIEAHANSDTSVELGGVLLLLALSVSFKNVWGAVSAWLAVVAGLVSVGWIGVTAHHGGELVYRYGVGTPNPVACYELPGVRIDGKDHAAERAAIEALNTTARQPATTAPSQATPPPDADEAPRGANVEADAAAVFFVEQVHPILAANCHNCHNATRAAARKSGSLDQTSREALLTGGRSGPAIVPGKPEESLLLHRLRGDDPDLDIMPPKGRLPDESIAIIEQWIREGAVWAEPE